MDQKKNTSSFDVDGRIYQTEYAIKSVSEAGTTIGIKCTDGVVLVGINESRQSEKTFEKISKITENVYCAFSGIYADYLQLLNHSRRASLEYKKNLGDYPEVETVCSDLSENLQIFTQRTGNRPFGVSFLFCGKSGDKFKLMSSDPSGTFLSWKAKAFGKNDEKINSSFVTEEIPENISMKEGTVEIFKILRKISEVTEEDSIKFEVLHFSNDFTGALTHKSVLNLIKEAAV